MNTSHEQFNMLSAPATRLETGISNVDTHYSNCDEEEDDDDDLMHHSIINV